MKKRILGAIILVVMLITSVCALAAPKATAPETEGTQVASQEQKTTETKAVAQDETGEESGAKEAVVNFIKQTGFSMIIETVNWQSVVMILIACVLLYLAIVKQFEPLLLLPIAFGMLLTNLLGAEVFHEEMFAGGHVHWDFFGADSEVTPGLIDVLYLGVKLGIYPCLIFIGVGAMTDFGPLIANPKSLLLGAAAQIGIFATFLGAYYLFDFTPQEAGSIGIIGGADGPAPFRTYCSCGIFIYGTCTRNSATHYESPYHQKRTADCNEGTSSCFQNRKDCIPHCYNNIRCTSCSFRSSPCRCTYAW